MTLRIAWVPTYSARATGYGYIAGRMKRALSDAGVSLVERHEADWDARVIVGLPAHANLGRGRLVEDAVYHTMFEAEPLAKSFPAVLNRCRLVWAPSEWCKSLFQRNGVKRPIMVGGYGVDTDIWRPPAAGRDFGNLKRPLRFGVWAHAWVDRKHAIRAVQAYLDADLKDVTLAAKITNPDDAFKVIVDGRDREDITVHRGAWPINKLAAWLQEIDVLLYLSGGEGFGLQPLEAMSTGAVVVLCAITGVTEYAQPGANCLDVPAHERTPALGYQNLYGDQAFTVAAPDHEAVVEAIRWCARNRDGLNRLSQGACNTATHWSWIRAGALARDRLSYHLLSGGN